MQCTFIISVSVGKEFRCSLIGFLASRSQSVSQGCGRLKDWPERICFWSQVTEAGFSFSQALALSAQFLSACGSAVLLRSLPWGPLQDGSLLPQSQQEGESAHKTEVTVLYDLPLEVTSLHLWQSLLVRSTLGGREAGFPEAWTRRQGSSGAILQLCTLQPLSSWAVPVCVFNLLSKFKFLDSYLDWATVTSSVTLGELFNLPEPHFLHL